MIAGRTKAEIAFQICNYTLLTILGLCFIIPYWIILVASFTSTSSFNANGYALWPGEFSVEAYKILLTGSRVWHAFKASIIITVGSVIFSVIGTSLAAYAFSKKDLLGRNALLNLLIFAMLFSGGTIPSYVLMVNLGLTNTYWAFILPGTLSIWNMILIRSYFYSIPSTIEEAAKIDGCRHFRIYWQIYMPLSMPILATIILFCAVGAWNSWLPQKLYIDSTHYASMMPLTPWLKDVLGSASASENVPPELTSKTGQMATVIITTLPIILTYPFLQKYFVKGIMLGSVKG